MKSSIISILFLLLACSEGKAQETKSDSIFHMYEWQAKDKWLIWGLEDKTDSLSLRVTALELRMDFLMRDNYEVHRTNFLQSQDIDKLTARITKLELEIKQGKGDTGIRYDIKDYGAFHWLRTGQYIDSAGKIWVLSAPFDTIKR
jgi:hypothetical protein